MFDIRIAVCDDNEAILDVMCHNIISVGREYDFEVDMFQFTNPRLLLQSFRLNKYDVLFLDVEMPEMNGFELAKCVRESDEEIPIIFVSHVDGVVYDTFEYKPFDFVRKEVMQEKFKEIFQRLKCLYDTLGIDLEYEDGSIIKYVNSDDIVYIVSDANYVEMMNAEERKYIRRKSLKELLEILQPYGFMQIHMRYIINKKYWERYTRKYAMMKNKKELYVGPKYREIVKDEYAKKRRP